MDWISVKDKLPSDMEKESPEHFCDSEGLLVMAARSSIGPYPLIGIGYFLTGKWNIVGGQGFYSCAGLFPLLPEEVTHWRPLP